MKKILSVLLLGALLLLCFSGCTTPTDPQGGTETDPATDPVVGEELENESDLVSTLSIYLQQLHMDYDMPSKALFEQIGDVKGGIQPLHVAFDPDSYYYVCGYYNVPEGHSENQYCCAQTDYTWVVYENAEDVKEYHNGLKWIALFQVNRALTVTDLLPGEREVPSMEHFDFIFRPTFENGVYTGTPETYDKTYIYLNYPNAALNRHSQSTSTLYYTDSIYYHTLYTIPCVALEGEYYLSFGSHTLYADGSRGNEADYTYDFGRFYTVLMGMMEKVKYTKPGNDGATYVYNAIPLEDFVNGVLRSPAGTNPEYTLALEALLEKLRKDAEETEKLSFYVAYEEEHHALTASGECDGERWTGCGLDITVSCDYSLAAEEDWYPTGSAEDEALNQAFFDLYANELTEGHFSLMGIVPSLYFSYHHTENRFSDALADFYADYEVIVQMLEHDWVEEIHISYRYDMPSSYFAE